MKPLSSCPTEPVPFSVWLEVISSNCELELEWLDLLSQLEYVGCRKILKGVPYSEVSLKVLQHASEEVQHAYLLKSLVERKGLVGRPWSEGMFSSLGWDYFSELDRQVSALGIGELPYSAVSWAIERRVFLVYPRYVKTTSDLEVRQVLSTILLQESRHREEFEVWGELNEKARSQIIEIEASLWHKFETALGEKIGEMMR